MAELSDLDSYDERKQWLERALRREQTLPLIVPDERPHLAIARLEGRQDSITRKDLRKATRELVAALARGVEDDDEYVASLTGLVVKLDERGAVSILGQLASIEDFHERPRRQQAAVLRALIAMRHPMADEFWIHELRAARHRPLALKAMLDRGFEVLDLLPEIEGDGRLANAVFHVLDQHAKKLDPSLRARMVARVASVVDRCSGDVGTAVRDWLDEQDPSIVGVERIEIEVQQAIGPRAERFIVEYMRRHQSIQLQRFHGDARLAG